MFVHFFLYTLSSTRCVCIKIYICINSESLLQFMRIYHVVCLSLVQEYNKNEIETDQSKSFYSIRRMKHNNHNNNNNSNNNKCGTRRQCMHGSVYMISRPGVWRLAPMRLYNGPYNQGVTASTNHHHHHANMIQLLYTQPSSPHYKHIH